MESPTPAVYVAATKRYTGSGRATAISSSATTTGFCMGSSCGSGLRALPAKSAAAAVSRGLGMAGATFSGAHGAASPTGMAGAAAGAGQAISAARTTESRVRRRLALRTAGGGQAADICRGGICRGGGSTALFMRLTAGCGACAISRSRDAAIRFIAMASTTRGGRGGLTGRGMTATAYSGSAAFSVCPSGR